MCYFSAVIWRSCVARIIRGLIPSFSPSRTYCRLRLPYYSDWLWEKPSVFCQWTVDWKEILQHFPFDFLFLPGCSKLLIKSCCPLPSTQELNLPKNLKWLRLEISYTAETDHRRTRNQMFLYLKTSLETLLLVSEGLCSSARLYVHCGFRKSCCGDLRKPRTSRHRD